MTTIDDGMEEIRQIFIEESVEGLDTIEQGLLDLEKTDDAVETVNDIFRAAHSVKGGAATFGYAEISQFTHLMETLLDRLRNEEMDITPQLIQLFLQTVDCLRNMFAGIDNGDFDAEKVDELTAELNVWLKKEDQEVEPEDESSRSTEEDTDSIDNPPEQTGMKVWHISFAPNLTFIQHGNQPEHLFRALADLGNVTKKPDTSNIPDLDTLNPEELHIKWDIELSTDVDYEQIVEIFDWVEDECDLKITALEKDASVIAQSQNDTEQDSDGAVVGITPAKSFAADNQDLIIHESGKKNSRSGVDRRKKDRRSGTKESGSIRVGIDKIDSLLNLVGEMVITQSMLSQYRRDKNTLQNYEGLSERLTELERYTRELQESVMQIRMLPVSVTFSRFPRLVHDLSAKLGKSIELEISGEQTELDKTVLEKIFDPLVHLIRNSIDHGIEPADERVAAGKSETGLIRLAASHEGGSIVIRVSDDGGGLNTEKILSKARERGLIGQDDNPSESQIHNLVFRPGFSTVDVVSDVSGRGVGMDVVCNNIQDIGGCVEVQSEKGKGSTFKITLPLTLAILDGQLIRVNQEVYVVPLLSVVETVQIDRDKLNYISGSGYVYRLRGEALQVIDIQSVCHINGNDSGISFDNKLLMVVEAGRHSIGLIVDELLEQHQIVIKSLENNFIQVPGMLGATILGDGRVALIMDVPQLINLGVVDATARVEIAV